MLRLGSASSFGTTVKQCRPIEHQQRTYAIMNRAKKHHGVTLNKILSNKGRGIPLDILRPKPGTQPPTLKLSRIPLRPFPVDALKKSTNVWRTDGHVLDDGVEVQRVKIRERNLDRTEHLTPLKEISFDGGVARPISPPQRIRTYAMSSEEENEFGLEEKKINFQSGEPRDRFSRDNRDSGESRNGWSRDSRDSLSSIENRDSRDSRDSRESRNDWNSRDSRDSGESRNGWNSRDNRDSGESRNGWSRESRDSRNDWNSRDNRDNGESRNGWSRDSRDSLSNRDSKDLRDSREDWKIRETKDNSNGWSTDRWSKDDRYNKDSKDSLNSRETKDRRDIGENRERKNWTEIIDRQSNIKSSQESVGSTWKPSTDIQWDVLAKAQDLPVDSSEEKRQFINSTNDENVSRGRYDMSFREQGNIRMNQNEPWNRSETQSDKDSNHYERDDLGLSFKNRNAKSYRNPDPRKKFHGLFRNTNYSSNEASEFEDVYRDIELKAPLTERKRSDKQEIKIRDDETNTDKNDDILRILTAKRRMEPAGLSQRLIKIFGVVEQPEKPHSLKVAVIGEPNAGKSTLINTMIGQEISVVSPKAHTTRERVLAVFTQDNYQVVFLDTPGIVEDNKSSKLDKTLLTSAWRALDEADHLIILVDSKKALLPGSQPIEENILSHLSKYSTPTTLVFNKMDLLDNQVELLQATAERYKAGYKHIQQTLFVSALQQNTLNDVKETLFKSSTPRLWAYPKEAKYEMSDLKRVEELIRVEFFKRLYDYIPYMLKQENTGWTEERNGKLRIEQTVYVERDSQQKIVVGAKGAVVDKVVEAARAKVSEALGREVQLFIQVRTKKK